VKSVVVTGSNGGIGTAICNHLKVKGYFIIGVDLLCDNNNLDRFILFDMKTLAINNNYRDEFSIQAENCIKGTELVGLVNNAAIQILGSLEKATVEDFCLTLNVNVVAPFVLTKLFLDRLESNHGSVVNIGSIHAKLTKPEFVSYATSKAALIGLTQSMAVDCGSRIRVNAIQPAATATEMLLAGFKDKPEAFSALKHFHPTKTIAEPLEIAKAVAFLLSDSIPFANGTVLDINGGIGHRLHDPI
jgi:NAD(P)-dependent dehydrogenase (short-subunit alcohol dehydrogenase family)